MTDATFKNALRELREDLERLRYDLEAAIDSIVGVDAYIEDDIITEEDNGSTAVNVTELRALLTNLDDAAEATADAFKEFDQEVERLWRRFKLTLVHSESA
jgi:hypothetical protein